MRALAGLGTLLVIVNGVIALLLNIRHWKSASIVEPPSRRRVRRVVTGLFWTLVFLILIFALIGVAGDALDLVI